MQRLNKLTIYRHLIVNYIRCLLFLTKISQASNL